MISLFPGALEEYPYTSVCAFSWNYINVLLLLQGYLIGNGATDSSTDNINIFQLYSNWPLIPPTLSAELAANECGTLSNPIGNPVSPHLSNACPYLLVDNCLASNGVPSATIYKFRPFSVHVPVVILCVCLYIRCTCT